jgi:hypothetical protein
MTSDLLPSSVGLPRCTESGDARLESGRVRFLRVFIRWGFESSIADERVFTSRSL